MQVEITINCEDEKDLMVHLSAIRQQIRQEVKNQSGQIRDAVKLEDSNCYGAHNIIINP